MTRRVVVLAALSLPACVEAWAQPRRDAGVRDAGVRDVTVRDATARDATVRDATARDATVRDAVVRDARARDAAVRDAAPDVVVRPPTRGRIEPREAQRAMAPRTEEIRGCYERALQRDPTLHGEVTVRVRVEEDGSVSETTSGGDPAMLRVGRCIEDVLRGVRFPRPTGGAATVAAPFVFQAGT